MAQFRFAGTLAAKEGVFELTQFGQLVELPEQAAAEAIAEGVALIPASEFEKRFTREEIDQYSAPESHASAPADFHERKKEVWIEIHNRRHGLTAEVFHG